MFNNYFTADSFLRGKEEIQVSDSLNLVRMEYGIALMHKGEALVCYLPSGVIEVNGSHGTNVAQFIDPHTPPAVKVAYVDEKQMVQSFSSRIESEKFVINHGRMVTPVIF